MKKRLLSMLLVFTMLLGLSAVLYADAPAYVFQVSKTYYGGDETVKVTLDAATAASLKAMGENAFFRTVVGEVGDLATASLAGIYDRVYCGGIGEDNTLEIPMRISSDLADGVTVYGVKHGAGEAVRMAGAYTLVLFVNDGSGAKAVAKSETYYLYPPLVITAENATVEPWTKPNDTDYKTYFHDAGNGRYLQTIPWALLCSVVPDFGYDFVEAAVTINGEPVPKSPAFNTSLSYSYAYEQYAIAAIRFAAISNSVKDSALRTRELYVSCPALYVLNGTPVAGSTLWIDGMTPGVEQLEWQASDNGEDGWEAISTEAEYTIPVAQQGKYIRAKVWQGENVFYTEKQQIAASDKPVIQNQRFESTEVKLGEDLRVLYDFYPASTGAAEQGTRFVWESAESEDGEFTAIEGASGAIYRLTGADAGNYIRVRITPVDADGAEGNDFLTPVWQAPAPAVSNAGFSAGEIEAGQPLTVSYTFVPMEGGGLEGDTLFGWESKAHEFDVNITAIEGADQPSYTPQPSEIGRYIRVKITPADENGIVGRAVYSPWVKVVAGSGDVVSAVNYFVAADGDDTTGDGTLEKPFATPQRARDAIRSLEKIPAGGVTVYFRGGVYPVSQTFSLEEQDSGRADAPIVYRAYGDEKVTFNAGKYLDTSKFSAVSGEMKQKLSSSQAQGAVVVADLDELGYGAFEKIAITNGNAVVNTPLFVQDGKMLKLSRYPNAEENSDWLTGKTVNRGYATNPSLSIPANQHLQGTGLSKASYTDDTISSWTFNLEDLIFQGYWRYDWYTEAIYATLDQQTKTIEAKEAMLYGMDNLSNHPVTTFRVLNVYEELDEPGEWYVDRTANKIYLYPYGEMTSESVLQTTVANFPVVTMKNTSYVTLHGIELTGGKSNAVVIDGGSNNTVDSCDINVFEGKGVIIRNGAGNGLKNSSVRLCGTGGVELGGGDRSTITHAGNFVTNNLISDFSISTSTGVGVQISGVGLLVDHNEISGGFGSAIQFTGVDNVMEYNLLHDVCTNSADMGAIYTGRNFADHGNVIRYNHFYNIGNPLNRTFAACAVFTDDGSSDLDVYGNVIGARGVSAVEAFKVHGGQFNTFTNNLILDAGTAIYNLPWGDAAWKTSLTDTSGQQYNKAQYYDKIASVMNNPLYIARWPWVGEVAASPDTITNHSNTFSKNVVVFINENKTNELYLLNGKVLHGVNSAGGETNLILQDKGTGDVKALFADFDNGDYRMDERIYSQIPDFEPIPFDKIGRYAVGSTPPTAVNVRIDGSALSGEGVLRGLYTYLDSEGDPEGNSELFWESSDTPGGAYTACGTGAELRVTDALSGKYVRFGVIPKDGAGNAGAAVWSEPFAVILGRESLDTLVRGIAEELEQAQSGDGLGQYPSNAIAAMSQALDAARAVDSDDIEVLTAAVAVLNAAYQEFKGQQVTRAAIHEQDITIPAGMAQAHIDTGEITRITLHCTGALPETTVAGTIGGKEVTFVVPAGLPGTYTVAQLLEQPGAALWGDPIYAVFAVGTASLPVTVTFTGVSGIDIMKRSGGSYIKIGNGNTVSFTTNGGEYAVTKLFTPSSNALLSSISIDGKKMSGFRETTLQYKKAVTGDAVPVVSAVCKDEKANPRIDQAKAVPGTATITVTAQNGKDVAVYTIEFTKKADPDPVYTPQPPSSNGNSNSGTIVPGAGNPIGIATADNNQTAQVRFADTVGHWAQKDIEEMAERGIVSGVTENTFEPDRAITRAEFATLLVKALNLSSGVSAEFSDVFQSEWYYHSVNAAANAGLIAGYDSLFRPNDLITREEMAVILEKASSYLEKNAGRGRIERFSDQASISDWAYDSVDAATTAGLISGMPDGTFAPKENATRAQAVSVIKRLLDL